MPIESDMFNNLWHITATLLVTNASILVFQLNFGPDQILLLLSKDQSLLTKNWYLGEKRISYLLAVILKSK